MTESEGKKSKRKCCGVGKKRDRVRNREKKDRQGLAARYLLYTPSHIQDSTYHGLCYSSHGARVSARNILIISGECFSDALRFI